MRCIPARRKVIPEKGLLWSMFGIVGVSCLAGFGFMGGAMAFLNLRPVFELIGYWLAVWS